MFYLRCTFHHNRRNHIVMDGKIVGAIGVSGAAADQDAQCAKAGVDALTK